MVSAVVSCGCTPSREANVFGFYQMGEFLHPNGIVTVYQQDDFTRMDFMHGDRLHTRQWDREWGSRTLPRLARQFVQDIFASMLK
jgi:hypothetical protein